MTDIPQYAFRGCTSITNAVIDGGVANVAYSAFGGCSRLVSVTLGDDVATIRDYAFDGCSGLERIVVGNGAKRYMGNSPFRGCDRLTRVEVSDIAGWCGSTFDNYYDNPLSVARNLYVQGGEDGSLEIPEAVDGICRYAFYNCTNIVSVSMPATLSASAASSFYGCTGLEAVNVTNLAAWCGVDFADETANPLYYARNLRLNGVNAGAVTLPPDLAGVKGHVFCNCTNLTRVTVLGASTDVSGTAFRGCTGIKSALLPRTLEGDVARIFPAATLDRLYRSTSAEAPAVVESFGLVGQKPTETENVWELTLDVTLASGLKDTLDASRFKVISAPTRKKLKAKVEASAQGDAVTSVSTEEKTVISFDVAPEEANAPQQFYRLFLDVQ